MDASDDFGDDDADPQVPDADLYASLRKRLDELEKSAPTPPPPPLPSPSRRIEFDKEKDARAEQILKR